MLQCPITPPFISGFATSTASMGRGIEAEGVVGVGDSDVEMPSGRETMQFYFSLLKGKLSLTFASAIGVQTGHA
jgi:hypothetical protein